MNRYRSIWLSDFHLGSRDCRAEALLDFLRGSESEYLYLVGDIVDGWALKRSWYWVQSFNDVIQKLLRKARKGTCVTYIPGNHDEFARQFLNLHFGGIAILPLVVHTTVDGRRLLVLHGDEFDGVVRYAKWLSHLGVSAYQLALWFNRWLNVIRFRLGMPYWSLSAFLKSKTKKAVQYVAGFEEAVAREARKWQVDGVVCGHIHQAELRVIGPVLYANTGDWVESCTALVEHLDGRLEIIQPTFSRYDAIRTVQATHPPSPATSGDGHAIAGVDALLLGEGQT